MKSSGIVAIAMVFLCPANLWAANATKPIDYQQRNEGFAPDNALTPEKRKPEANDTLQGKRVEKAPFTKAVAPIAGQKSAVEAKETREKTVVDKNSHRPEADPRKTSDFNRRESSVTTSQGAMKRPMVAKYQDSLVAASATNMARFPAADAGTVAKINRFVFRKNPSETGTAYPGATVTPAGGSAKVRK